MYYNNYSKWKKEDGNDLKNQICPKCKNDKNNTEATFNLLFPIASGVLQDKSNTSDFLRPETCQEMYYIFSLFLFSVDLQISPIIPQE